ncbi:hypothetical protein [Nocardia sp. NPDC056564]|uniref:hypothetical protein n=1 Tax=Nocardia sp. NPDC056564 TaxID=3345865 RepID=UPI00366A8430
MALKDVWFRPDFNETFPSKLLFMGTVEPMTEFNRDRNARKRQKVDLDDDGNGTGKRLWKGTVADPSGMGSKDSSFDVIFLADVQPVPVGTQFSENVMLVELEGLQIKPKMAGSGEFKSIGWSIRATGFKGDNSGTVAPGDHSATAPRSGKAAA